MDRYSVVQVRVGCVLIHVGVVQASSTVQQERKCVSNVTQVRVVPRYDSPASNLAPVRIPEEDPPEYT